MKTRNGIYYDLSKSCYKFKIPDTNIVFHFSSDLHLVKFQDNYMMNRREYNVRHKARYRIDVDLKILPDVMLYKKIETRGFYICEGGQVLCLENVLLTGEKVILKN